MTARELFTAAAPLLAPAVEAGFQRRDLCILSTRIIIDVAQYFGIEVRPQPVRVMVANAAFAVHIEAGDEDVYKWSKVDGSWSVGIGYGKTGGPGWDGHLIAMADGTFADYSIWNAERPQHGIVIGPAVIGPHYGAARWLGRSADGVALYYERTKDDSYRRAPDWRMWKRRRPIVAELIRAIKRERAA